MYKSTVLLTGHFNHSDYWVPNKRRHKRTEWQLSQFRSLPHININHHQQNKKSEVILLKFQLLHSDIYVSVLTEQNRMEPFGRPPHQHRHLNRFWPSVQPSA